MQRELLVGKTFSITYPLYDTPDGRKWLLMSVVGEPTA